MDLNLYRVDRHSLAIFCDTCASTAAGKLFERPGEPRVGQYVLRRLLPGSRG